MGVDLRLGVRINTGGCEVSLFITMHTGLDRFWHSLPSEWLLERTVQGKYATLRECSGSEGRKTSECPARLRGWRMAGRILGNGLLGRGRLVTLRTAQKPFSWNRSAILSADSIPFDTCIYTHSPSGTSLFCSPYLYNTTHSNTGTNILSAKNFVGPLDSHQSRCCLLKTICWRSHDYRVLHVRNDTLRWLSPPDDTDHFLIFNHFCLCFRQWIPICGVLRSPPISSQSIWDDFYE
jgi:hypothetical protein